VQFSKIVVSTKDTTEPVISVYLIIGDKDAVEMSSAEVEHRRLVEIDEETEPQQRLSMETSISGLAPTALLTMVPTHTWPTTWTS
jgi:hypothetical protein